MYRAVGRGLGDGVVAAAKFVVCGARACGGVGCACSELASRVRAPARGVFGCF